MSKRKRSIGGDDCSSDIESPGPYKSFEINLKHALPWDPAKMDALMKDPRYRSQPTYSFYRTKFERCDVEIRCPAGLRVGNQCFYVESKMFQPYPRFWTYLMKNRVSKPGEPLATQLNIRPIALEHILRDIGDVDRELVEKEFNKLSFTVLLDIHCICHMAHMQALADKAAARFGVQAAFVLGKYCGSGNELEKSLYECLPRVLRCNRFAQDQLQAKMDVRLFDEVKVLFYAYRDRMFKTPHKIVAFLGSCPGFAEEVALDAIRDKINTRRLGCPRCGLWLKDLPLPYQSLKCTNCNASMSMETLLPSQGGDGSVYLKFTDLVHSTQALGPQAPPQGSIGALQPPRAPLATTPSWYALQASGLHQCKHIYPVTRRQCDTVFGNAHDLARHKNMLHGKEGASHCQYCWQCGEVRMFSRHDDLMRHVASVHPEEQPVPSIEHGQ